MWRDEYSHTQQESKHKLTIMSQFNSQKNLTIYAKSWNPSQGPIQWVIHEFCMDFATSKSLGISDFSSHEFVQSFVVSNHRLFIQSSHPAYSKQIKNILIESVHASSIDKFQSIGSRFFKCIFPTETIFLIIRPSFLCKSFSQF